MRRKNEVGLCWIISFNTRRKSTSQNVLQQEERIKPDLGTGESEMQFEEKDR
jgi:hypothetical protein